VAVKDDLVSLSDFIWQRTRSRLNGLSDEEYFWEPVAGCWTIRDTGATVFYADGVRPPPAPAPFTTLAWRMAHLTDCYGADRNGQFLGAALEPVVLDPDGARPGTAEGAVALLERAHTRWRRHLTAVASDSMAERLGPVAGPYADGTRASFVLHMLDESIHHGAELAVLRDLFAASRAGIGGSTGETLVDEAICDPTRLAALTADPVERDRAVRGHPDAVTYAASAGRWDLVVSLLDLGFAVGSPGPRSALHLAAGAGALHAVRCLVERGADTAALDSAFGTTPLGWAQYFGNRRVAEYLAPFTSVG
jgi:hypothetical protein